jgi:hypothetical protein
MGAINPEDLPVVMQNESVEIRRAEVGEMTVVWSRLREGFYWAPGHVPIALEDCEYMDFSPTEELMRLGQ